MRLCDCARWSYRKASNLRRMKNKKRILIIIGLLIISILSLFLLSYLNTSSELAAFLSKTQYAQPRDELAIHVFIGLAKILSLVIGIANPITVSIIIIKENLNQ